MQVKIYEAFSSIQFGNFLNFMFKPVLRDKLPSSTPGSQGQMGNWQDGVLHLELGACCSDHLSIYLQPISS